MSGLFITFEGIDGVGKTFIMKAVEDYIKQQKIKSLCFLSRVLAPLVKLFVN